jgi:signal transduction histidine kinase
LQEEVGRAWDSGDPARSVTQELELFRQDGSTVWAEVKASVLRDDQGRPVGVLGVSRDISARRKLEAQLQQAQKMEVVGRLAGGVAHDFNNLLTAILGYSELLLDGLDTRNPAHQNVTEIKKAGERASLLTRQLLAFSRRQVLQPKSLQLNLVIENFGKMLKRVIGEDIRLEINYGADLGWVMADPGQIEQVILNLTVNARDAMPKGGKLTIETANMELDETYAQAHDQVQPGHYVVLAVTDTGSGMDAATRSHIFEPFFTTKGVGQGTGLGLSTVYGIVRQSGGHIWVYSELGQGTTFKIYLPRVEAKSEAALPGLGADARLQGYETILVVEDDGGVREVAGRILRKSGYQVLEAQDGRQALQICKTYQGTIHLVLTDLVMPGMNGRDLAVRLASLRPGVKVAFMSGYDADGIIDEEIFGTGTVFIQKPFKAHVLTRKIWELLNVP